MFPITKQRLFSLVISSVMFMLICRNISYLTQFPNKAKNEIVQSYNFNAGEKMYDIKPNGKGIAWKAVRNSSSSDNLIKHNSSINFLFFNDNNSTSNVNAKVDSQHDGERLVEGMYKTKNTPLSDDRTPTKLPMNVNANNNQSNLEFANETTFKTENSDCLRLVVPFTMRQTEEHSIFLSTLANVEVPPCNADPNCSSCTSDPICIHLHMMLDQRRAPDKKVISKLHDKILNTIQRIKGLDCVAQTTFSVFKGGSSAYYMGSYLALKHIVLATHKLGYKKMALLELDAFPLQPGWMRKIFDHAFDDVFFMIKGTRFDGVGKKAIAYGHINGNCLWNTENGTILTQTFAILDSHIHSMILWKVGYDVMLYHLLGRPIPSQGNKNNLINLEKDPFEELHNFVGNHQLKDVWSKGYINIPYIQNSHYNQRPSCKDLNTNIKERMRYISLFPESIFIHCRFGELKLKENKRIPK